MWALKSDRLMLALPFLNCLTLDKLLKSLCASVPELENRDNSAYLKGLLWRLDDRIHINPCKVFGILSDT